MPFNGPLVNASVQWMGEAALVTIENHRGRSLGFVVEVDGEPRQRVRVMGNDHISLAYKASMLEVRYDEPGGASLYSGRST